MRRIAALFLLLALGVVAHANPPAVQQPMLAAKATPVITYVSTANNTAPGGSTCTFNTQGIGTASTDRVVIVAAGSGVSGATAQTITMTIGGTSATQIVAAQDNSGNATTGAIFALPVATGTTANIVVSYTSTQSRCAIFVFSMTGTNSVVTARASGSNNVNSSSPSISIGTNANGAALALSIDGINGGVSTSQTWSGLTEDADITFGGAPASVAHANNNSGSSLTIQSTFNSTTTASVLVGASW